MTHTAHWENILASYNTNTNTPFAPFRPLFGD